jgi:peptidoglycan hydrolase-like protein with peptidoglycan-binding domain
MTGPDVTALQQLLIAQGYAIPAGATGYFGAQTQTALIQFQIAKGIVPAAGYFGPATRAVVEGL